LIDFQLFNYKYNALLNTNNCFKGVIDDIRIYNRLMTPEEYRLISDTTQNTNNLELKSNNIVVTSNSGDLKIKSNNLQNITVSLYSIEGRKRLDLVDNNQYVVSGLPKGLYLIRVIDQVSKQISVQKVILH
jgi:hypothetical protein